MGYTQIVKPNTSSYNQIAKPNSLRPITIDDLSPDGETINELTGTIDGLAGYIDIYIKIIKPTL